MALQTFVLLLSMVSAIHAAALGSYGGDPDSITVSGLSAGACFAVQFHVAFSSEVIGAGIVAGTPYYCAQGNLGSALNCMDLPTIINVNALVRATETAETAGNIDPVANLENSPVFLFSGTADTVVMPGAMTKTETYYSEFSADIKTEFTIRAQHSFVTVDKGNLCAMLGSPYINHCDYNLAFEILNHVYGGGLTAPEAGATATGQLLEFDQNEFFTLSASAHSMDEIGYIYVPENCNSANSSCRVHLSFHGCQQGRELIDDQYATLIGINEVADANDIIVIYPQNIKNLISNPNGCFDWWGYTNADYAYKTGPQMAGVHDMLLRVLQ